jgi:hypothetical protein
MNQPTVETNLASMGLGSVVSGESATSAASAGMNSLIPPATSTSSTTKRATVASGKTSEDKGESKRRGPNSHRVRDMFAAVGTDRVPLDDLIEKYHVSVHVARQSKRFDPYKTERGQVVIKTLPDEATGQKKTYVWRAPDVAK